MKKFFANIICSFVPDRQRRKMLRLKLTHSTRKLTKFAKSFSDRSHPRVRHTYGFRCANFVITVDDKFVFKFPLHGDGKEIAQREKLITDVLRKISPIKIPDMEILDFNGMTVRKYEYIDGKGFHSLDKQTQNEHAQKIAHQLARFLYIIGKSDPVEIRKFKNEKSEKPSIMYGWCQNDLWDNFIMDPETFDIIAIIDWEDAGFNDFSRCFTSGTRNYNVKNALLREYLNLYLNKRD